MSASGEELSQPAWSSDHPASTSQMEIQPPYFDEKLGAWVLSRHADLMAAFRAPELILAGANPKKKTVMPDEDSRLHMRTEAQKVLSTGQLREWGKQLGAVASDLAASLPASPNISDLRGRPVDLFGEFAKPLCLTLAVMVTGADPTDAARLEKIARHISEAAADPYDPAVRSRSAEATPKLKGCFHAASEALRDPGFVALSNTLPCLLANVWYALVRNPQEWGRLHQHLNLTERAVEELLRYAGLTRLLFRRAVADVELNGTQIRKGDHLILRIIAANRDPERFPHPDHVDIGRRETGQLSLGAGLHSCVGANLIRMAAITLTRPLVERFASALLTEPVEWHGGAVFRSPVALRVLLCEAVK